MAVVDRRGLRRIARGLLLAAALPVLAVWARPATAQGFSVQPLRLSLGGAVRSTALTVRNDDTQTHTFTVHARHWDQNDTGEDVYSDAPDLILFPRRLALAPGQVAVVRLGTRSGSGAVERAYRVFVEQETSSQDAGTQIQVRLRIAAPLFVAPRQPLRALRLETLIWQQGQLQGRLVNAGSHHERLDPVVVRGLDAQGVERFRRTIEVGYLLAGRQRTLALTLPTDLCAGLTALWVAVHAEATPREHRLPRPPDACP